MDRHDPQAYRDAAVGGWRWVLDQVQSAPDGPWIPESVPADQPGPPADRDGMHSGIGGLAHALAEIRVARPWTAEEEHVAATIRDRIVAVVPTETVTTFFDGLVSHLGVLVALSEDCRPPPGVAESVARLIDLAEPDGWPQSFLGPPRWLPSARISDATLGTASVLLGAVWATRHGVAGSRDLAGHAIDVLLAEAEEVPTGLDWRFVPERFRVGPGGGAMPNWSHGLAGVAGALAAASVALDRPDLVEVARAGAEHLVSLGVTSDGGLRLPQQIPQGPDHEEFAYGWCHGPTGTSLLFAALHLAGVEQVAGEEPLEWQRRCLTSVRRSGLPQRLWPGFWDNDGRCCGTAGVGDVLLDAWQLTGHDEDREFALELADTLVERTLVEGPHTVWRFVEHRRPDPLLPPGVGWMQGVAGIATFLARAARVAEEGRSAATVPRMETWWALPQPT